MSIVKNFFNKIWSRIESRVHVPFGRVRTLQRHAHHTWTPDMVTRALRGHERGDFVQSAMLGESMRRDARVYATLESIVSACLAGDRIVESADKDAAQMVDKWFWKSMRQSVLSDLIRSAILYGFAVAEMAWKKDESDGLLYPDVRVLSVADVRFDQNANAYFFREANGGEILIEPGNGRWLFFSTGSTDTPFLNGAIRAIAMPWLIRSDVISYWIRRTEIESTGAKKAKVPSGSSEEEGKLFLENANKMGAESTVLVPDGYDLEFVTADLNASTNFSSLVDRMDTAITLALLRQNLTTQIEGGSFASAQVHAKILQDNARSILQSFSDFSIKQLVDVWHRLNFENWTSVNSPIPKIDIRPTIDKQQEAQALLTLSQALNALRSYGVDTDSTIRKFGLDVSDTQVADYGEIFAYHIDAGIFTINEVRASRGYPPIEGGDVLPQRSNETPKTY